MNPVELGQGTFPLSEAATDRFAIMINIPYLPPEEEEKLVSFDFKQVRLNPLMTKERIIELRGVITREVFLHEALAKYIRRLVGATRPFNAETEWHHHSPSDWSRSAWTSARRRARRSAGVGWSRCGRCSCTAAPRSIPRTSRSWRAMCCGIASGSARTRPATASRVDMVIDDVVDSVPVP